MLNFELRTHTSKSFVVFMDDIKTKKIFFVLGTMPKECELEHIENYERHGSTHGPHTTSLHNLENPVARPSVIETSQPHIIECT